MVTPPPPHDYLVGLCPTATFTIPTCIKSSRISFKMYLYYNGYLWQHFYETMGLHDPL